MHISCHRSYTTLDRETDWANRLHFHLAHDDHPGTYWDRYTQWQIVPPDGVAMQFKSSNNIFDADRQLADALQEKDDGYDVVTLAFVYQNMLKRGSGMEELSPEYLAWKYRDFNPRNPFSDSVTNVPPPERMTLPENPRFQKFRERIALIQTNFSHHHGLAALLDVQHAVQEIFMPPTLKRSEAMNIANPAIDPLKPTQE